ncbi:NAD(P)-binding protein [Xylariaceae sp. FL0662B]|nr:NAD(P)-binding protein [Xylariaceae sp. FL0662B]
MASHHVLLLGGYGKVAQLLTPTLLQRSWNVTSIIRNPDQLNVLVRSIDDIKTEAQAKAVLDEVKPGFVVWSAGAGGKGALERAFDRGAACFFIRASVATPSITKFILISFIGCRHQKAPWLLDEAHWQQYLVSTRNPFQRYYMYEAKLVADEGADFAAISLRPGRLTLEPVGKVSLGKLTRAEGLSSRASLARSTALLLLESDAKSCWLDMLDGEEDPEAAAKRCVQEGVDCVEGETFLPLRVANERVADFGVGSCWLSVLCNALCN